MVPYNTSTIDFVPKSGKLFGRVATVLPGTLYFASFHAHPAQDAEVRYVSIDERVHYEPFYSDFGPLNLSVLYRFCKYLHGLVEAKSKRKICCWTNSNEENRVNGAYLLASYIMIYQNVSADEAYLRIRKAEDADTEFIGFRDAAMGDPTYLLHIHHVLKGIEKAMENEWLDFDNFDPEEYEYYERVENGDFNWIIPGKILSFCGPHEKSVVENGYPYHAPEVYFDYFREHNVSTIVRLNMKLYDASRFTNAGFDHVDLFFIDGSTPSDEIVERFIDVVDKARGGVAIHCKAGLGRTGTLIACWMMKEFGLTAAECMGWLRVCRPGSVIGPQQEFLVAKQKFCWNMANNNLVVHIAPASRTASKRKDSERSEGKMTKLASKVDEIKICTKQQKQVATVVSTVPVVSSNGNAETRRARPNGLALKTKEAKQVDETAIDEAGRTQGDRLLAMKVRSQHKHDDKKRKSDHQQEPVSPSRAEAARPSPTCLPVSSSRKHELHRSAKSTSVLGNGTYALPQVARLQMSPRFSSPTTPIKPMSTSPSLASPASRRFVARNLLSTPTSALASHRPAQVPITKVTVLSGSKMVAAHASSASRSTSALRRATSGSGHRVRRAQRLRARPYPPSAGVRLELSGSPSGCYDLRSRRSPNTSSSSCTSPMSFYTSGTAAAATLPPNSEALIGRTRALKKKYASHGISALTRYRDY